MEFKILGKTRLQVDGNYVDLGSAKQRGLLALLLYEVGRPVRVDRIVQALWRDSTVDVRGNLQVLISRLRKVLGETGSGGTLSKEGDAYLLTLDPSLIDYHQFRRFAEQGRIEAAAGNHLSAKSLLQSALALWQGRPLEDLTGPWAEHCRYQMETFDRLQAYYSLFESQLQLHEHFEVMTETGRLNQEHEEDETFALQHLRSLHGLGRYPTALEFHSRFCEHLFDSMGIEPGPEMRTLYQDILRKQAGTGVVSHRSAVEPPHQLPRNSANFAGRADLLAKLDALLEATGDEHGQVVALHGMPGIGKSTLAIHWANRRMDRFPDGQLFLDLQGFGPGTPMAPDDALGMLLTAMGRPTTRESTTGEERQAELRKVLRGRRVLLVLDNALDSNQVRPLLAAVPNCFTVVTSRTRPWGLTIRDNVKVIAVPPLPSAESVELLCKEIGDARGEEDPAALRDLASRSDGLPLGLRIIAQHIAHRPQTALADLVDEFKDQEGLGILGSSDDSDDETATLPVAFSWSYLALPPDTARAFRLLGLHPTTEFSISAVCALLRQDEPAVDRHLRTLTKVNLLQHGSARRYRLHDLLHGYAVDLVDHENPPEERDSARRQLLDWYLGSASSAAALLDPQHSPVPPLPDVSDVAPLAFDHEGASLVWFTRERANLIASVSRAAHHNLHGHAWRLSATMHEVFDRLGHYEDLLICHQTALKSARLLGNEEAQSGTLNNLGMVHFRLHRYPDATDNIQQGLEIAVRLGLREMQAICMHNLASVHLALGEARTAIGLYERALEVLQSLGARNGMASTLNRLANAYHRLERDDLALEYHHRALAIREQIGHLRGQGSTLTELGKLLHEHGDDQEAVHHLERALEVHRLSGDRTRTNEALVTISEVYYNLGQFDQALSSAELAIQQAPEIGAEHHKAKALHMLGHIFVTLGNFDLAESHWRQAADLLGGSAGIEADLLQEHLDILDQMRSAIPDPRVTREILTTSPSEELTKRNT